MAGRNVRITLSLPEDLIAFADSLACEQKTSRSKVVADCLRKQLEADMIEGYKAMAKENLEFAALAAGIEHEVMPEWKP